MTRIGSYHRPTTIADALALLSRPHVTTVPLGGGTVLNGLPDEVPDEVVDLQALDLDGVDRDGALLTYGAMVRLQDVVHHDWTPPMLRELAHRSSPQTLRNMATVGGAVAGGDWEDIFLAGLLAYGATVTIATSSGYGEHTLEEVLADRSLLGGGIISTVAIDLAGTGASAGTARTPADVPIVMVAGTRSDEGTITLAATGLASTPIIISPGQLDALDPPGDFRGSPAYRRHLAVVLSGRVMAELEAGVA